MSFAIAAFYRFVTITDGAALRAQLHDACAVHGIIGTILIAPEGINATIAGSAAAIDAFLSTLTSDPRFTGLDVKRSACEAQPFQRLKVKLKPEIVTFGVPAANPAERAGTYIEPADWNALIADPDIVLIDTRNAYEVAVGTFPGAIDPGTQTFGAFPDFAKSHLDPAKTPKVAMFCTGGIRCEKASAYLLGLGFDEVYHLRGGILRYLETVPPDQSLWQGECFVFDERVAVDHGVVEGKTDLCGRCWHPVTAGGACTKCGNIVEH
jgi:UPF0176 protein